MPMYVVPFKIEYFNDILGELSTDYLGLDVINDAFLIFLTLFDRSGSFIIDRFDDDYLSCYYRRTQAVLEDVHLEDIDDDYSLITEALINSFLDNICGMFGQPPTHPMNMESLYSLIALYHDNNETLSIMNFTYCAKTCILKLVIEREGYIPRWKNY